MDKVRLPDQKEFGFLMPVVLVGAEVSGRPAYLTAAWVTRVESSPPQIAIVLSPHHTNLGIEKYSEFSINVPGKDMVEKTDYCGMVSGNRVDKSLIFETFKGELQHAPMIKECPITMECRVVQKVPIGRHTLYVGEVVGVYKDKDQRKSVKSGESTTNAIVFSSLDAAYFTVGKFLGKAWDCGKKIIQD
ncbi:MAG: flavin reductase family protein [Bacteroidetes bacterium]|nr:flavin reductase family protein [Bacteroidota bacterium]